MCRSTELKDLCQEYIFYTCLTLYSFLILLCSNGFDKCLFVFPSANEIQYLCAVKCWPSVLKTEASSKFHVQTKEVFQIIVSWKYVSFFCLTEGEFWVVGVVLVFDIICPINKLEFKIKFQNDMTNRWTWVSTCSICQRLSTIVCLQFSKF